MDRALLWLKGLVAAFIGGSANGITVMIVDPVAFNFKEGLGKVGMVTLISGIFAVALYLKQSPVPNGNKPN